MIANSDKQLSSREDCKILLNSGQTTIQKLKWHLYRQLFPKHPFKLSSMNPYCVSWRFNSAVGREIRTFSMIIRSNTIRFSTQVVSSTLSVAISWFACKIILLKLNYTLLKFNSHKAKIPKISSPFLILMEFIGSITLRIWQKMRNRMDLSYVGSMCSECHKRGVS